MSNPDRSSSPGLIIKLTALGIFLIGSILLAEVVASLALVYRYRWSGTLNDCGALLSTVVLAKRAAAKLGWAPLQCQTYSFDLESIPSGFLRADDILGWSAVPGEYTHVYKRRKSQNQQWERFPLKVTINQDQSRWSGKDPGTGHRTVYVFGDSFTFGDGVNDEQTFTYLLHAAKPEFNVKLFALGGYGLVQTYLRFKQLSKQIGAQDIIVIAYADFYDVRNVAAPSRLRETDTWRSVKYQSTVEIPKIPKAAEDANGKLSIELVEQDCRMVRQYCDSRDPSPSYMTSVSALLINEIATNTKADVYLLHFSGVKSNGLFDKVDKRVKVISALQQDFGHFIWDDIVGFDPHPGPYWHYDISRNLIELSNEWHQRGAGRTAPQEPTTHLSERS